MPNRRASPPRETPERRSRSALPALAAVAVGLPAAAALLPAGRALLEAPRTGIVLAAGLAVAPALAGIAVALRGPGAVRAELAAPHGEPAQAATRIAATALLLAYAFAASLAVAPGEAAIRCLVVAALGLACAWLFLAQAILSPAGSALRRRVGIVVDVALLSAYLHAGGGIVAAWWPLYPALAIRHGGAARPRAQAAAIAASVAGFALVVATTGFWRRQPALAGGLLAATALLPAYVATLLRGLDRARARTEAASAADRRLFAAFSDELRDSLKAILRADARLDRTALSPDQAEIIARMRLSARAGLVQADAAPTYAAIAAGAFAPDSRPFDLYQLVHGTVAALRPQAADRGIAIEVRIDPRLPYELRGWPHQLRQILVALGGAAVRQSQRTAIEVQLDAAALTGDEVRLGLCIRDRGARVSRPASGARTGDGDDPALAVAERLAAAMGGTLDRARDPRTGLLFAAELPFALDRAAAALPLDLDRLPVMIATDDPAFADQLAVALASWQAEPRWIGGDEPALAHVEALTPDEPRPVLVVDGRGDVLSALSWAHRATRVNPAAVPYVLFIADEARIDSVIGLAVGQLDAILPAPFTAGVLQSTLHALRVGAADWFPVEPPLPLPALAPEPRAEPSAEGRRPPPARLFDGAGDAPPQQQPRPAAPEPPLRHSARILVAAANAANRRIIGRILATAGHAVDSVADADAAQAALAAHPVDLVLLDCAAPTRYDIAIVEQCRETRPDLPILALSGDAGAATAAALAAAGVDAVLAKPVEPSRLIAAIETAIFGPTPAPPLAPDPPASDVPAPDATVTEISAHPRFARTGSAAIDRRAIDALWSLGGDNAFFADVIAAFRADSRQLLRDIGGAAAIGDTAAFAAGLQALRNCTASLGGTELRELLQSIPSPSPPELRLKGPLYVQQVAAEVARLDEALASYRKIGE